MSKFAPIVILVILVGGGVMYFLLQSPADSVPVYAEVIEMRDDAYEPANITIPAGTSVTFKNTGSANRWPASNIHPTHQIFPEFDSARPIVPQESWTFRFEKPGIWRWHDHLEPTLTGTITVE